MTATAAPAPLTRRMVRSLQPVNPLTRPMRVVVAALLLLVVGAAVYWNSTYRAFEATLAALTLSPFADGTGSSGTTFFLQRPDGMIGLVITAECTALILIAPLIVLAAVILVITRASWGRVFAGTAAMWIIVTIVNEIRLAFIGFASDTWGTDIGYPLSHTYIGSVIGILGFVAGLAALVIIAGTARRRS